MESAIAEHLKCPRTRHRRVEATTHRPTPIASPRVEHYETMFNTPDRFEGVGVVMGELSGELQEHGYWGSMRDRIPLSQTDAMSPSGSRAIVAGAPLPGQRVQVTGHQNIAMIRSRGRV